MKTFQSSLAYFIRVVTLVSALSFVLSEEIATGQTKVSVLVDRPGAAVPSTLFGLFFEDINFGADGGLYPERVKNRSFEFTDPLMGWRQIDRGGSRGKLTVLDQDPINDNNSHYLRLEVEEAGKGFGVMNEGFRGIGVQQGADYTFSVYARSVEYARP